MASGKAELIERLEILTSQLITNRTQSDVDLLISIFKSAYQDMSSDIQAFINMPQKGAYNTSDRNRVSELCNSIVELMQTYYGVVTEDYVELPENWEEITDPTKEQLETYINSIIVVRDKYYAFLHREERTFEFLVPASDWVNNTITIYDENLHAVGYEYYMAPRPNNILTYSESNIKINDISTEGYISFRCEIQPEEDIVIYVYRYEAIETVLIDQIYDGISLETANNIEIVLQHIYTNLRDHFLKVEPPHCGLLYGPDSSSILTCGMPYLTGVNTNI